MNQTTKGYWVHCQVKDRPELAWGWFSDHEPTEAEIKREKEERGMGREIEITWSEGTLDDSTE